MGSAAVSTVTPAQIEVIENEPGEEKFQWKYLRAALLDDAWNIH